MIAKTLIRSSQSGWAVIVNNDVNNFIVFRSDEPERFVKFIAEKVAGIKIDQLLAMRRDEIAEATRKMEAGQRP